MGIAASQPAHCIGDSKQAGRGGVGGKNPPAQPFLAARQPGLCAGQTGVQAYKRDGVVARALRSPHHEALDRAVLMAQGGEFAFVLYAAAAGVGLIDANVNANLTAIVVLSMVLTPLALIAVRPLLRRGRQSLEGVDQASDLRACVLVIGFGRFGQVASQSLLAGGMDVSIIDSDAERIRNAERFGFKVYYGDGTRLDVLHASGAGQARAIADRERDRRTCDAASKA